jgi:hypothetical protein
MLTINQDKELFSQFAIKHKGINSFYFGDESEADTNVEIIYPFFNVILQNSTLSKGIVTRNYLCIVSDLVNKDVSNIDHVISDTEQICFDLPNYLRAVSNSGLIGAFKVNDSVTLTDFTERNDDDVSGHFFDLTISSPQGANSCNLPIEAGNILTNNYIYVGGTMANGFTVEIKDQNGNVIQTFNTSGEYVVTVLTGIQQVIGNTSTTITQDIID